MKMIVAILSDDKTETVANDLLQSGFRVTKFASTAGFLSGGTTTLMVGVKNDQLAEALSIIRENFSPLDPEKGIQATVYVLDAENFERIP